MGGFFWRIKRRLGGRCIGARRESRRLAGGQTVGGPIGGGDDIGVWFGCEGGRGCQGHLDCAGSQMKVVID